MIWNIIQRVITVKKDGSVEILLYAKTLSEAFGKDKYQPPYSERLKGKVTNKLQNK